MPKDNDNNDEEKGVGYYLKQAGWFVLSTAVVAGTVIFGAAEIASAIGFKEKGVERGSMAARYQSANAKKGYNIGEGSLFSDMQRFGTKGMSDSTQAGITLGSAAAVAGFLMLKK